MGFTGKDDTYQNTVVENDGFFPDLILGDLQRQYRVPAEYETGTVLHQLRIAILDINGELSEQKTRWQQRGIHSLSHVDNTVIDNINANVLRYQSAVFCKAKALLLPQRASTQAKSFGDSTELDTQDSQAHWLKQSRHAVNALLGYSHSNSNGLAVLL